MDLLLNQLVIIKIVIQIISFLFSIKNASFNKGYMIRKDLIIPYGGVDILLLIILLMQTSNSKPTTDVRRPIN